MDETGYDPEEPFEEPDGFVGEVYDPDVDSAGYDPAAYGVGPDEVGPDEAGPDDPPPVEVDGAGPAPGLSDAYPDEPTEPDVVAEPATGPPVGSALGRDVDTTSFGAEVDGPGELVPGGEDSALSVFPSALPDVELPPPVDGLPWVDGTLLGGPEAEPAATPAPADRRDLLTDLRESAAEPGAGWDTVRSSDDPAVRALSMLWAPAGPADPVR